MRFFVDEELRTQGYETNPSNPQMRIMKTELYIEVQLRIEEQNSSVITYVIQGGSPSPVDRYDPRKRWLAAACLGEMPEFLWCLIQSTEGAEQESWIGKIQQQCPTLIAGLGNAAAQSGDAALLRWMDDDDKVDKWFLAVIIQRDFRKYRGYFEFDEHVDTAINGAMYLAARICREILEFRLDIDSLGPTLHEALDKPYEEFNRLRQSIENVGTIVDMSTP